MDHQTERNGPDPLLRAWVSIEAGIAGRGRSDAERARLHLAFLAGAFAARGYQRTALRAGGLHELARLDADLDTELAAAGMEVTGGEDGEDGDGRRWGRSTLEFTLPLLDDDDDLDENHSARLDLPDPDDDY